VFVARKVEVEIALVERRPQRALDLLDEMMDEGMGYTGFYHVESLEARSQALRMAGHPNEAAHALERLLLIHGYHAPAHYQLATLYEQMGRDADARRELARFLEMWSNADAGLPELDDARERLAGLSRTP
jgi:tetratricopeptide (TPR) repeat protein